MNNYASNTAACLGWGVDVQVVCSPGSFVVAGMSYDVQMTIRI